MSVNHLYLSQLAPQWAQICNLLSNPLGFSCVKHHQQNNLSTLVLINNFCIIYSTDYCVVWRMVLLSVVDWSSECVWVCVCWVCMKGVLGWILMNKASHSSGISLTFTADPFILWFKSPGLSYLKGIKQQSRHTHTHTHLYTHTHLRCANPFSSVCMCMCVIYIYTVSKYKTSSWWCFNIWKNKTYTNNTKLCVCLTAPIPVDHAADSRADVRGGGCCDCYSVLCLGADIYHIGLWEQKNK